MFDTDRDWVSAHYALLSDVLPREIEQHLGLLIADTIAIGVHARATQTGATRHDLVGIAPSDEAAVWGLRQRASALDAALLNGTAAEVLDFQEVLINGRNNGHAAVVIVPAVLALAEARGIAPERVMRAVRIALAANMALGEILGRNHRTEGRGFRTTSLTAGPAAALGCAALISDDPNFGLHALSIAASTLPAGLLAAMNSKDGAYSEDKDLSVGLSANHALRSGLLALNGAEGPAAPITSARGWLASYGLGSEDISYLHQDPAARDLTAYSIKLYPANFGCQAAIRALIELRAELGEVQPSRIELEVKSSNAATLANRKIDNHIAARFSLAYAAASAWLRGRSVLADFEEAEVADPLVRAFMDKVEVIGSDEMERRHLSEGIFPAAVRIYAGDKLLAERAYDGPFDGYDAAQSEAAFEDKLQALCPPMLAKALADYAKAPCDAAANAALTAALKRQD